MTRIVKKKRPILLEDFEPHPADAESLKTFANIRLRYRLTPKGRVWSVHAHPRFEDRHVEALDGLAELIEFNIWYWSKGSRLTLDSVCRILHHPRIQAFQTVRHQTVTDEAMLTVAANSRLRWINFLHCQISDRGVEQISGSTQLLSLGLVGAQITDRSIKPLSQLTNLRRLFVTETGITTSGLEQLSANLPRCRVVGEAPGKSSD